jgi:ABC-type uncharacterized transport system ATPase subunit
VGKFEPRILFLDEGTAHLDVDKPPASRPAIARN